MYIYNNNYKINWFLDKSYQDIKIMCEKLLKELGINDNLLKFPNISFYDKFL